MQIRLWQTEPCLEETAFCRGQTTNPMVHTVNRLGHPIGWSSPLTPSLVSNPSFPTAFFYSLQNIFLKIEVCTSEPDRSQQIRPQVPFISRFTHSQFIYHFLFGPELPFLKWGLSRVMHFCISFD